MNRGGNGPPAGSTCGGMYRTGAQSMCEENVRCVGNVCTGHNSGAEAPDASTARRAARVKKIRWEEEKMGPKDSKKPAEGRPSKKQTSHDVPRWECIDMQAPVWWQLEVEGHSSNGKNKNRIRRFLRRTLDHLEANNDIPEEMKCKERQRRRLQLEALQRPPRVEKQKVERWRKKRPKNQRAVGGSDGPNKRSVKWAAGHRLPPC